MAKSHPDAHPLIGWVIATILVSLLGGAVLAIVLLARHSRTDSVSGVLPSATSPTASVSPDPTANWQLYTSSRWGYSIKYPPGWYNLPNFGAPDSEKYFSNENVGAPLQMDKSGVFLAISVTADIASQCRPRELRNSQVATQTSLLISGVAATRYVTTQVGTGPILTLLAAEQASLCYRFEFISYSPATTATNLPMEDLILTSFRFGTPTG